MDARTAELIRTIDTAVLGQRLRAARLAAGLKQSDVAGDEVTAAYISRIEAGQRRPDPRLLERMASRLSVELATLLEDIEEKHLDEQRVQLDHAELSLVSGDGSQALERVDLLLSESSLSEAGLIRRARQLRALSLEAVGRGDEAIKLLEELVTHPEADVAWIKSVIALSRCYRESGDFARAISVGERAESLIEELELGGTTEAIQLTVTVAGAYLERGDLAHALQICQRCIEDAERVNSPIAKASAYWNASVIESFRGNPGPALELAQKAMALFELGEDSRNLGRLRTQVAYMQLIQDPPDALTAKHTLELAERELAWSSASQVDRARHRLMSAKAAFELHEHDDTLLFAESVRELVGTDAPILLAEAHALTGRVRADQGDPDSARHSYGQAIEVLSGIGVDRDVARLWFDLAGLLEHVGDSSAALDAYRRGATATGLANVHAVAANTTSTTR